MSLRRNHKRVEDRAGRAPGISDQGTNIKKNPKASDMVVCAGSIYIYKQYNGTALKGVTRGD